MKVFNATSFEWNESIQYAFSLIPERLHRFMEQAWFLGMDPVAWGVHEYENANLGRSLRNTCHVMYPAWLRDKSLGLPAVMLCGREPRREKPWIVVHELGHVLDWAIEFERPNMTPTSWYAGLNTYETFAEAFTVYVMGKDRAIDMSRLDYWDIAKDDFDFFESLR